jgi:uncharacterized protein YkwD
MQGKVIKKTVPNVPLVRTKEDDEPETVKEIIVNENKEQKDSKGSPEKLRGARNRIKRKNPFTMNASDGSSKTEKTETKPDGTIVRTIVEINGNQKKTTVITTKGGSTSTNTRIETIGGGGGKSGGFDDYGYSRNDSGFDNFNKMWNEQVNQMNNFYNNFGNFGNYGNYGNGGYHYEFSSGYNNKGNDNQWNYEWNTNTGKNNKKKDDSNKKKKIQWEYDWGDDYNKKDDSNKKKEDKNIKWEYDWGDNNYNRKDTNNGEYGWWYDDGSNKNNKKNDGWSYEWGTDDNNKKKTEFERKVTIISGNEFQQSALKAHNKYREKHHVGELKLSKELCDIAQKYAEKMARTSVFAHSDGKFNGKNMGENLFACYGMKITGKMMTDDWYNEVSQYDFNNPGFSDGAGHFTQLVWKGSREVGFGYAQASDGYYYGVANYYPAGNYLGEFEDNVFRS